MAVSNALSLAATVVCNAWRTLKTTLRNISFIIFFAVATYVITIGWISNYLTDRHDLERNTERTELGLSTIGNDWKLDSTEFIAFGNYSTTEREGISNLRLKFEDERLFCQYWSPIHVDSLNPFQKVKRLFYYKSNWLWKNKLLSEHDVYINPKNPLENESLIVTYDYPKEEWFSTLDTFETALKRQLKEAEIDSLVEYGRANNLYLCGTSLAELEGWDDFYIDTVGLTRIQADSILKKWGIN